MTEPCITVLAGTSGAGKSSIGGAALRRAGADWFDPDAHTRELMAGNPGLAEAEANSLSWQAGVGLLRRAIQERRSLAFETTLGGSTITGLLLTGLARRIRVRVWYAGLDTPERHLARVRARVAVGGHWVSEGKVRSRYESSRRNLVQLIAAGADVAIYDNSAEADPSSGATPSPRRLVELRKGALIHLEAPDQLPDWARPLAAAAILSVS